VKEQTKLGLYARTLVDLWWVHQPEMVVGGSQRRFEIQVKFKHFLVFFNRKKNFFSRFFVSYLKI